MEGKRPEDFGTLLDAYGKRKHPLDYHNRYQLVVMVLLSARDSDRHINSVAPALFSAYPDVATLATAELPDLLRHIQDVTNCGSKAEWLIRIARSLGRDEAIPRTKEALMALPGIGPKSANVIIRESGDAAEGVVVDLHVLRTAPRIGLASGQDAKKVERQLMAFFPQERWNEAGMALSFLGREICRPSYPKCDACPVHPVCDYAAARRT